MKRYFLFDLDGTITDTGEGILKSVCYALEAFGIREEKEEKLRRFVGPPLSWSFETYYGFSKEEAQRAVEKYRERYREKGVFENSLYPGIREVLEFLSQRASVCLSTSKPLVFARQILAMRGIDGFFSQIVGANLDGTMTEKDQVIRETLHRLGDPPPREAVMIGDRRFDIEGAKKNGLESVGCAWGYPEKGELEAAGADYLCETVPELLRLGKELLQP